MSISARIKPSVQSVSITDCIVNLIERNLPLGEIFVELVSLVFWLQLFFEVPVLCYRHVAGTGISTPYDILPGLIVS